MESASTHGLQQKQYENEHGTVTYWVPERPTIAEPWLVLLPGLLADHRLFEPQIEHFTSTANVFVWDPPAHHLSRPYDHKAFTIPALAGVLHDLLERERITQPIVVGQSLGGVVAQACMQQYPDAFGGFISIGSMPMQRDYFPRKIRWALRFASVPMRLAPGRLIEPVFEPLMTRAPDDVSTTDRGKANVVAMLESYSLREYGRLVSRGFSALGKAISAKEPVVFSCPTLLIAGEKDAMAGSDTLTQEWAAKVNVPYEIIPDAGHNANVDDPEAVNALMEAFLAEHGR